jgi:hypothetical protein
LLRREKRSRRLVERERIYRLEGSLLGIEESVCGNLQITCENLGLDIVDLFFTWV